MKLLQSNVLEGNKLNLGGGLKILGGGGGGGGGGAMNPNDAMFESVKNLIR